MMKRCILVAVLGLTLGIYWVGLNGPLLFDDAQNLAPINAWLQGRLGWQSVVFDNSSGRFGRSIAMASFVANAAVFGDGIWSFKLVNLMLHLFNGAAIFALLNGINRRLAVGRQEPANDFLPLLAASIWLVHPLLVSTVLYVVQRMAILSASFSLLAMLSFFHGRSAIEAGKQARAWRFLALVPIATVAAALSKENGVLAPALCGAIEWFVFRPPQGKSRGYLSRSWIGATLALPAIVALILTLTHAPAIVGGYANRPFTLVERLLTQPRVLWDYVGSILLPYGPRLGLYHDDYLISHGLMQPIGTLVAILGWLALAALAWGLRKKIPGFAFGVTFFLVGHAIESTVFPLLMYFEHRNYLPAIGIIWAALSLIITAANQLRSRMQHANVIFAASATCLVLVLALATNARAAIWSSLPSLLAQDLANHPNSPWLRIAAAGWALDQSPPESDVARSHLNHLLHSPDRDTRRMGAGARLIVDCSEGLRADPALIAQAFSGAPKTMESDLLTTYESLADAIVKHPCKGLSVLQFARNLDAMLDRMTLPGTHFMIRRLRYKAARMYLEAGDLDDAAAEARMAHQGKPIIAPMTVLYAEIELRRGNLDEATKLINVAAPKVPADDDTGQDIIRALKYKLAVEAARKATQRSEAR